MVNIIKAINKKEHLFIGNMTENINFCNITNNDLKEYKNKYIFRIFKKAINNRKE